MDYTFSNLKDCTACYNEIMKAIQDCTDAEDVMKCVEEVLLGVSDCVVSISFLKN